MFKINLHKLADKVVKIGGPLVLAAVAHQVATGKFDVKALARDAASQALDELSAA
jgi:hypothetical protein